MGSSQSNVIAFIAFSLVAHLAAGILPNQFQGLWSQCGPVLGNVSLPDVSVKELSIDDIRTMFGNGKLTSELLVCKYLERVRLYDGQINSILELNPDLVTIAKAKDAERASVKRRNAKALPILHGIPVLLKDNIDTDDKLNTTAGSFFLLGSKVGGDAFVVKLLRDAGAIIFGKAQMTEWANYRSTYTFDNFVPDGWSPRGPKTNNPYDLSLSPGGSSAGSGAAVAASLVTVSLGTDSFGSVINPAQYVKLYGVRPTPGLTSRRGVIPIWLDTDSVGVLCRIVDDCAYVMDVIAKKDTQDYQTNPVPNSVNNTVYSDYSYSTKLRIGYVNFGYIPFFQSLMDGINGRASAVVQALTVEQASQYVYLGVEPYWNCGVKLDLEAYFRTRIGLPNATMAALIEFTADPNSGERIDLYDQEVFYWAYNQSVFEGKVRGTQWCNDSLAEYRAYGRTTNPFGLERVFAANNLDVLIGDFLWFGNDLAEYASWPSAAVPVVGPVADYFNGSIGIVARPFQEEKLFAAMKLLDKVLSKDQMRFAPPLFP